MILGFFENRLSGILRYPLWLHPSLLSNSAELTVVYFYEEIDCDANEVLCLLPKNTSLIKISKITPHAILELLRAHNLDRLVVMAQRIPDSCMVVAAKKLDIPTVMYQHGLYVPFMKRQPTLFVNNAFKTLRYLQYVRATAGIVGVSLLRLLTQYIRMFVLGHNLNDMKFPMTSVNTDSVLVYGEFWREYHSTHFGYKAHQQYVVGAPDFTDVHELVATRPLETSICYIAQTLVEDGRLPRATMLKFVSNLAKVTVNAGLNLKVRLHPRSDVSLYQELPHDTKFSKTDFPKTTAYVGHYSSILAKATFMSNNIILVDFPDHDIPDYIAMLGSARLGYDDVIELSRQLTGAFRNGIDPDVVSRNIEVQDQYFDSSIVSKRHGIYT